MTETYDRHVVRVMAYVTTGVEPALFPEERDRLVGAKQSTQQDFRKAVGAGIADRPIPSSMGKPSE
jgi:hypothetical protein